jgi:hypothetical protein
VDVADVVDAPDAGTSGQGAVFIQTNATNALGSGSGPLSDDVPLVLPPGVGNTLIVAADYTNAALPQITDNNGNVFTLAVGPSGPIFGGTVGGTYGALWYATNVRSAAETVTIQIPSGTTSDYIEAYVTEYSGIIGLDSVAAMTGTSVVIDSGPLTTSSYGDLLFAFVATGTAEPAVGFTLRSSFLNNLTEDESLGAPGTADAIATMVSGGEWIIVAGAFRTW